MTEVCGRCAEGGGRELVRWLERDGQLGCQIKGGREISLLPLAGHSDSLQRDRAG